MRHDDKLEPVETRIREAPSAAVEFAVRWDERRRRTYISEYAVWLAGAFLLKIENLGIPGLSYVRKINDQHPCFTDDTADTEDVRKAPRCWV